MYVSVTLGGMGRGDRMSISPPTISSPSGWGVKLGYAPGAGVMRMMSGKGVVRIGTAPSSSKAKETSLERCLILSNPAQSTNRHLGWVILKNMFPSVSINGAYLGSR